MTITEAKDQVSDEAIDIIAHDEAQQDWNDLKFKPVYKEGYIKGFRECRFILLPIIEEKDKYNGTLKEIISGLEGDNKELHEDFKTIQIKLKYAESLLEAKQKDAIGFAEMKNKLQKCYTEIWKNMSYPMSMKGQLKADDILKKEFPFLNCNTWDENHKTD